MKTCSTCKHRARSPKLIASARGACTKIGGIANEQAGPATLTSWHGEEGASLNTTATFGCNLHEPRNEASRLDGVPTTELIDELVTRGIIMATITGN
jgi:hypothetical protein